MDQTAGMLSEEVKEKGYVLLCVAQPQGSCRVRVIPEVSGGARREGRGGERRERRGRPVEWARTTSAGRGAAAPNLSRQGRALKQTLGDHRRRS